MQYKIQPTHINLIKVGDVVQINGELRTVGNKDLKKNNGEVTLWGDSYDLGTKMVPKAVIHHALPVNR